MGVLMKNMKRFILNDPSLKQRRRDLRNIPTGSEKILWEKLRKRQLGVRFVRQFSIGNYILDFYSPERKLGIELDGEVHRKNKEIDSYRTRTLEGIGIRVLRYWNSEVEGNIENVLLRIRNTLFSSPS